MCLPTSFGEHEQILATAVGIQDCILMVKIFFPVANVQTNKVQFLKKGSQTRKKAKLIKMCNYF